VRLAAGILEPWFSVTFRFLWRFNMKKLKFILFPAVLLAGNVFLGSALNADDKNGQCEMIFPGNCICVSPVTETNCYLGESESCDWSYLCNPQ